MSVLYILIAIFAFGLMIFLHELGHFLVARACGVAIGEFSLGMGPRLCGFTGKGGTAYNLRLFPIGGFVSMKGEDEEVQEADSFSEKKAWQRFLILAVVLMFCVVLASTPASTQITGFSENAVSHAKLAVEDTIVRVDGTRVHNGYEMAYEISHSGYQPIDVEVVRAGESLLLQDVVFPTVEESGVLFGKPDFSVAPLEKTPGVLLSQAWYRSLSTVKMIWESLTDLLRGRVGVDAVSGPVGVTTAIGDAAKAGALNLCYLISVLSMNLGVFNLLPVPALDGGRLFFILIEMVTRRRVPEKFEGMVHFIGIMLLFGLMILITFKDIVSLFL